MRLHKADESLEKWLDKLALPGMLLAVADAPQIRTDINESWDDYQTRCDSWLDKVGQTVGRNLKRGWAAMFSNVKLDFKNTNAGAAGAKDMMELILHQVFSGPPP